MEKKWQEKNLRVALVHDFLVQIGGAEKVLEAISEIFPEAPIYTMLYDKEKLGQMFAKRDIRSSYLQNFPRFLRRRYQWLAPFFPVIPETFNLRDFDLIISSSGAWSKGIVTKLETKHIAYVHSPMRFVWDYKDAYLKEKRVRNSIIKRLFFSYLRIWDRMAADRPDYLIANSKYTQKRITKYYRRQSSVIYPPVADLADKLIKKDQDQSSQESAKIQENYFLTVCRLSGYKKVDVIVKAFNELRLPLVVIGEGEQLNYLKKIAQENVKIVAWQSDESLAAYYQNARAFVFAAEDDFGIAPVEAMSFGLPVIAYRSGGALETVVENETGIFYDSQKAEVLTDAVRRFLESESKFNSDGIRKWAKNFSKESFREKIIEYINKVI